MPIEGPLRELGIHDVFQLLDLSRKTGQLRVVSHLRDNEGMVSFREGCVVAAWIRSNPHPLGLVLLRAGKITEAELDRACAIQAQPGEQRRLGDIFVDLGVLTRRELDRQVRRQIEAVVFELMSWQEGYFSFTEKQPADIADEGVGLSTESLLMEAARRIDEWARISHRVPGLHVVPALAPVTGEHAPMLDLRPSEWELLAAVDGATDLRAIADRVGISDFDAAKIVYGLLATGVVVLREAQPATPSLGPEDALMLLGDARDAWRRGDLTRAIECWHRVIAIGPDAAAARQAREALDHASRLRELVEAGDER